MSKMGRLALMVTGVTTDYEEYSAISSEFYSYFNGDISEDDLSFKAWQILQDFRITNKPNYSEVDDNWEGGGFNE